MSDFDEFLNKRNATRAAEQEQAKIKQEHEAYLDSVLKAKAATEWQSLKDKIRALIEGKEIDGSAITEQGNSFRLKNVAAKLYDGMIVDGVPKNLKIVFGRNPAGHYIDDSRLESQVWGVEAFVSNEEILWLISPERGQLNENTEALASRVVKALVRYHDAYETAYGRA
jgi:hypothetical protein